MIIDYLNEYFKQNNISQKDIVNKTKISQSKVSLIFNKKRNLTADELIKIAVIYNIDLNKIKENYKQSSNLNIT